MLISPSTQNTLTIEEMDLSITALTYEIDELNKSYGIKSGKIKE